MYVCVNAGQASTRVMQASGMSSVMHTADHSHKMRKICSDGQLTNDGGSVNMYIVPFLYGSEYLNLPQYLYICVPRSIMTLV